MKKFITFLFIVFICFNANASSPIRPFYFNEALHFVFELAGKPDSYRPVKGLIKYYFEDTKFIAIRISQNGGVSFESSMGDLHNLKSKDLLRVLDQLFLDLEEQLRDAERHGWQLQKFFSDLLSLITLDGLRFQLQRLKSQVKEAQFAR